MDISDRQLKDIAELAHRQVKLEQELAELNASAKVKSEQLKYVSEVLLPNAMSEAELANFTLESGESIEIKRDYAASISEANFPAAKIWLEANGSEGIIKHVVSLSFVKGEGDLSEKAIELLIDAGYAPTDKESIHPQTLKATVKEYLRKAVDVPYDVFGVFEIVKAKVTVAK